MQLLLLISYVSEKLFGNLGISDHSERAQPLQLAERSLPLHPDPTTQLLALLE